MKFKIKNPGGSLVTMGRKIGYIFQGETSKDEVSFIRPLERSGYPRFHLYIKMEKEELVFNLHLDQKRPVYETAPDHAAEYEGKPVEDESQRIQQTLL